MLLNTPETPLERVGRLLSGMVLWALCAALLLIILGRQEAHGAPKAKSGEECSLFADMTLVVRSMALEGVPKATAAKTVTRIYDLPDERVRDIAVAVIEASYRDRREAKVMAIALLRTCVQASGDMDSLLGVRM